jgi:hypothetical protein
MKDDRNKNKESSRWMEEIEVSGNQLVNVVKRLIRQGNVRRLVIRNAKDRILMEIPLSAGIAVGGVATIISPILVALGAMAAMIASFKVEVIRKSQDED